MQRPGYVICYKTGCVLCRHDLAHRISVKHSVQDYILTSSYLNFRLIDLVRFNRSIRSIFRM